MSRLLALLPALLLLALPAPCAAQRVEALAPFARAVARLWASGDVASIVALAADGRIEIAADGPSEAMDARHAAAALRSVLGGRETSSMRPLRVTLAGGRPPRGFGEFEWVSRPRGAAIDQRRSVYVGAVWTHGGWRIDEVRIMP